VLGTASATPRGHIMGAGTNIQANGEIVVGIDRRSR